MEMSRRGLRCSSLEGQRPPGGPGPGWQQSLGTMAPVTPVEALLLTRTGSFLLCAVSSCKY